MHLPAPLRAFVVAVILLGGAVAAWVVLRAPFLPEGGALLTALLWLGLVCIVDLSPMQLPRGGATATVSSVLDFAAILVLGPAAAVEIGLLAVLLTRGVTRRDSWYKLLFNGAQIALAIGVSGLIYTGLGGPVGGELTAGRAILPLLACGAAYFLVNTALVSVAVGLSEGLAWRRIWQANFQWETVHLLALLPLGLLVALVLEKIGAWAVLLLFVQLLVIRYTFKLTMELREANRGIVSILASAIEASDPYLHNHLYRVSRYAVRVARAMGLPERSVEVIETSALLHDLGKIKVDHRIFGKPSPLSPDETATMRQHPRIGGDWIREIKALREVRGIIASHHERPDGTGYPAGLTRDEVPIGARIVGVLDAYDAMTSDRPYRKALPPEVAIGELVRGAGRQFDEEVVMTVKRLYESGDLLLEDGPDALSEPQLRNA
jgi:putative nucleotidyltransferase with HDIG domain